ncbi:MAG: hypothetical protein JYX80_11725 [Candidatus Scalindua sediminis]|nr:hypothetical protein [Candidatus Scalindua sediminis]
MEPRKYHEIRTSRAKSEFWGYLKEKWKWEVPIFIIGTIANYNFNHINWWALYCEFSGVLILICVMFLWKSLRVVPECIYEEKETDIKTKDKTIELLEERQRAKLIMEFYENSPSYCHDEFQENKNPNTEHIYDFFKRVWRISIYNDSSVTTIKDVKVKLTVEGANDREVILKFADNNTQPYWRFVDIAPEERVFIDVLEWFMQRVKEDKLRFDICHIEVDRNYTRSPQCCYYTDKGDSKIKIVVFGKDIPSQSRYFMVGARNNDNTINKICMWEA